MCRWRYGKAVWPRGKGQMNSLVKRFAWEIGVGRMIPCHSLYVYGIWTSKEVERVGDFKIMIWEGQATKGKEYL